MHFTSWAAATLLAIGTYADANASMATHQVTSAFQPPQHWQHNNLVRSINLEKSYPREYVNVVIENISPSPQDEYYIPVQGDLIGKVGGLEVKDKKATGQIPFVVELLGNDAFRYRASRVVHSKVAIKLTPHKLDTVLPRSSSKASRSIRTTNSHNLLRHTLGPYTAPQRDCTSR
jgi:hypothetical protein